MSVKSSKKSKKRSADHDFAEDDGISPSKVLKHAKKKDHDVYEMPIVDVPEWTLEESLKLMANMKANIGNLESLKFNTAEKKLNWQNVAFENRDGKQCQAKWNEISKKIMKYRTLNEIVVAAEKWIKNPFDSKKGLRHPDKPKKPLTPYFRYFLDKRQKYAKLNPTLSMTDLAKIIAIKFKELSEKKRAKYQEGYNREYVIYKEKLKEFREGHPECFESTTQKKGRRARDGLFDRPQTAFNLFKSKRLDKIGDLDPATKTKVLDRIKAIWVNLSDAKRVKWIRKAVLDEARYFAEVNEYCLDHPDYKPPTIKPSLTKYEKELKDRFDGKPDRPPNSGYSLFSKIMLKELSDMKSKEKLTVISKRWKMFSPEERQSYNDQAETLKSDYKEQYNAYLLTLTEEERQKLLAPKPRKKPAVKIAMKSLPEHGSNENGEALMVPAVPKCDGLHEFQTDKLSEYEVKFPALSKAELIKFMASEYEQLSDKKKKKYEKKALKNSTEFAQLPASNKASGCKTDPKKPPSSAYSLFSSEMLRVLTDIEPRQRMSEIGKRWKKLSAKDKAVYQQRCEAMATKFNKDFTKFVSSMSAEEYAEFLAAKNKIKSKKSTPKKSENIAIEQAEKEEEKQQSASSSDSDSGSSSSDDEDSSASSSQGDDSSSDGEGSSDSGSEDDSSGSGSDSDESSDDSDKAKKK